MSIAGIVAGLALAATGADGPGMKDGEVAYEVRIVTAEALGLRDVLYKKGRRVGGEGDSKLWQVDEATAKTMLGLAGLDPRGGVVEAGKATSRDGRATIATAQRKFFVVNVNRADDGSGFVPETGTVDEMLSVAIDGRRDGEGVRAKIDLAATWVNSVTKLSVSDSIAGPDGRPMAIRAQFEVPQVVETEAEGEYQVPSGCRLVVSLGTSSYNDWLGRAATFERVAIISARPIVTEAEEQAVGRPVARVTPSTMPAVMTGRVAAMTSGRDDAVGRAGFVDKVIAKIRPMPPLPSRSPLPMAGPGMEPIPMPPLPDDQVFAASAVGPPSPRPSPQAPAIGRGMHHDSNVSTASYEPVPIAASSLKLDGKALAAGQTQSFRIPLGGKVSVEIKARVVPANPAD